MKIYIARSGKTYGPYTEATIRRYLAEGSVSSEDLAWIEDFGDWVDLKQVLASGDIGGSAGRRVTRGDSDSKEAAAGPSEADDSSSFSDVCVTLMEWMNRNKYILGVEGARSSLQKKKAVSIGKTVAGAIGLFTKVPLGVTMAPYLSSLSGGEEGFRRAVEVLEPLCDVLGVRPLDGRILAIINADELTPNEILLRWKEIDSQAVPFHDLLPMVSSTNRMACFVYPIQVYSPRENHSTTR